MGTIDVLKYDRAVSSEFLALFTSGGVAASLREYAHARYPIDLQFRKDPKTGAQRATLYVGMTAVLHVYDKKTRGFALGAHPRWASTKNGWGSDWATPRRPADWATAWPGVENYLERVIPDVMTDGKYTKTEGVVQAAVTAFLGDPNRAVIDREVVPGFKDAATSSSIQHECSDPLTEAIANVAGVPGRPPTFLGMECDALAIDAEGHLLAIEIKPGSVGTLAWVPAQATMYARVLQRWIDEDTAWRGVVTAMFEQRKAIGLVPASFVLPDLRPKVVPAVAYQRIASLEYVRRMRAVQEALLVAGPGIGDPGLRFYEVSLSGRLDLV